MDRTSIGVVAVFAAALASGCASLPDRIEALERAQAAVNEVDRNPDAERVAGAELRQAKQALGKAEAVKEQNGEIESIRHYAYLAERHADIVEERVAEAAAREKIERSEAKRAQVLLEARTEEAERARMSAQRAEALAETRAEQAERLALEAQRQRERAEAAIDQAETLAQSLEELKAKETERGLVLTLSDVLFDTNEAELKPGADKAINLLTDFLRDNDERRLLIEGHTDSRGSEDYNRQLSQRRADALREALIDRGIEPDRLRAVGQGESYPVATNDTAAGRQENRRVEIIVSDESGEFPPSAQRVSGI